MYVPVLWPRLGALSAVGGAHGLVLHLNDPLVYASLRFADGNVVLAYPVKCKIQKNNSHFIAKIDTRPKHIEGELKPIKESSVRPIQAVTTFAKAWVPQRLPNGN